MWLTRKLPAHVSEDIVCYAFHKLCAIPAINVATKIKCIYIPSIYIIFLYYNY